MQALLECVAVVYAIEVARFQDSDPRLTTYQEYGNIERVGENMT